MDVKLSRPTQFADVEAMSLGSWFVGRGLVDQCSITRFLLGYPAAKRSHVNSASLYTLQPSAFYISAMSRCLIIISSFLEISQNLESTKEIPVDCVLCIIPLTAVLLRFSACSVHVYFQLLTCIVFVMPRPLGGGIKRCFSLTCMTSDVCLSHRSGITRE